MSIRELLIASSSQSNNRTFIAKSSGSQVVVYEWKRSGLVTQDTLTISGVNFNEVAFSPAEDSIAVYDQGNTTTYIYAWNKDTGFGSVIDSLSGYRLYADKPFSPSGDAIALYKNSDGATYIYNYSSSSGVGSLIDDTTGTASRIIKFSKSGNYVLATQGNSTVHIIDWDVSTGLGSTYFHPSSIYGSRYGDLSKDDSFLIVAGESSNGGLNIFPFNGTTISSSSDTITLNCSIPQSVEINDRQNLVLAGVADSTASPYHHIRAVPINSNNTFGTEFSISSSEDDLNTPDNARFNSTGNIIVFTQISNFVVQKISPSGFGTEIERDTFGGLSYADVLETA
jgi:hypothetical protein